MSLDDDDSLSNVAETKEQRFYLFDMLLILIVVVVTFFVLGVIASTAIALLYVNSGLFCRDCDTGLGLCGIGFCIGGAATPLVLFYGRKLVLREKG